MVMQDAKIFITTFIVPMAKNHVRSAKDLNISCTPELCNMLAMPFSSANSRIRLLAKSGIDGTFIWLFINPMATSLNCMISVVNDGRASMMNPVAMAIMNNSTATIDTILNLNFIRYCTNLTIG